MAAESVTLNADVQAQWKDVIASMEAAVDSQDLAALRKAEEQRDEVLERLNEAQRRKLHEVAPLPPDLIQRLDAFHQAQINAANAAAAASGKDETHQRRGINQSARLQASAHAKLTQQLEENDAPFAAAYKGIPANASKEAHMFYQTLADADPNSLQVIMGPMLSTLRLSKDPEQRARMGALMETLQSKKTVEEQKQELLSDPTMRDTMAVWFNDKVLLTPEGRAAIENGPDEKFGGHKDFDARFAFLHGEVKAQASQSQEQILNKLQGSSSPNVQAAEAMTRQLQAGNRAGAKAAISALFDQDKHLRFGLTDDERRQMSPSLVGQFDKVEQARIEYQRKSERTHRQIMMLIDSGLPIEMVVLLVLLLLGERQEDKLKLRMKELALREQIEAEKNFLTPADAELLRANTTEQAKAEGFPPNEVTDDQKAEAHRLATEAAKEQPPESGETKEQQLARLTERFEKGFLSSNNARFTELYEKGEAEMIKDKQRTISEVAGRGGLSGLNALMQMVQAEQTEYKQLMDMFAAVLRILQDMAATPIRNIR